MRVVIDTNCLIAAIPRSSEHYWLYQAFMEQAFEWVVSQEIITEYEEMLSEFYAPSLAQNVLKLLSVAPHVIHIEAYFKWSMIENDPDDNKFADIALHQEQIIWLVMILTFRFLASVNTPELK